MRLALAAAALLTITGLAGTAGAQPKRQQWDTKGWIMLGEQTVDYEKHKRGNRDGSDTDRITVGKYEGKFSKLQLVVDDSDMTLNNMKIVFADNTEYNPKLAFEFKEGARTRQIDLPPGEQRIQFIDLDYKNSGKRDHQKARVQVWGFQIAAPPPPPPPRAQWDTKGWQMLGEQTVDYGRKRRGNRDGSDTDRIEVGKYEGRFGKLQLVVDDSDMTLNNMKIIFADNTEYNPKLAFEFKEGARTRQIDLPPGEQLIRYIDLDYKNSGKRDREKARVQVWGFKLAPVVKKWKRYDWDQKGWQMLGEETVDYARHGKGYKDGGSDSDRITVGRYEGKFSKVRIVVDDSEMSLNNMKIVFADNTEYNPKLAYEFKEGAQSRDIDLPPSENVIKFIDLDYKNSGKRDGEKARVTVWGFKTGDAGGRGHGGRNGRR